MYVILYVGNICVYVYIYNVYIYIYIYIYTTHIYDKKSARISEKQDRHNVYVIMKEICPKWLYGNNSNTWTVDGCDVH